MVTGKNIMASLGARHTNTLKSSSQTQPTNTYTGGLGDFNVFTTVNDENEKVNQSNDNKLLDSLKKRSEMRVSLRTGKVTTGNKDNDEKTARTSEVVDGTTQVLLWLGKSPDEVEKYQTSTGGIEAINKLKGLQGGKFSGDIQDYIDGKSSQDLTGLMTTIFPESMGNVTYHRNDVADTKKSEQETSGDTSTDSLQDTRSTWEKMTTALGHTPGVETIINTVAGAGDKLLKQGAGVIDWFREGSPTSEAYEGLKGNTWNNMVDDDSLAFDVGGLGTEAAEIYAGDKLLTKGAGLVGKGYNALKNSGKLSSVTPYIDDAVNATTKFMSKDGAFQNTAKDFAEGAKNGVEMQVLDDAENGEISDLGTYATSAGIGGIANQLLGAGKKLISEPKKVLRTSLKRMEAKDVDNIVDYAETASKDATLPSALNKTTNTIVTQAKNKIKEKIKSTGKALETLRKGLGTGNLGINKDFVGTMNKNLTKKGVGAQIIRKGNKYVLQGEAGGSKGILDSVVSELNSMIENTANKQALLKSGEKGIEFNGELTNFENMISKTKNAIFNEKDSAVQQSFNDTVTELENSLYSKISGKDATKYKDLRKSYSTLKTQESKLGELEKTMNSKTLGDVKLSDNQYVNAFLKELEDAGYIDKGASDKRIAALFADTFYGGAMKDSDKLIYPSVPGVLEGIMEAIVKTSKNPNGLGKWSQYANGYKPGFWRQAGSNTTNAIEGNIGAGFASDD